MDREGLRVIVFESYTRAGRVFDVALIAAILASRFKITVFLVAVLCVTAVADLRGTRRSAA